VRSTSRRPMHRARALSGHDLFIQLMDAEEHAGVTWQAEELNHAPGGASIYD